MSKRIRRLAFVTGLFLILGLAGCASDPTQDTGHTETDRTGGEVEVTHSTEQMTWAESTEE